MCDASYKVSCHIDYYREVHAIAKKSEHTSA